jgi:uncharacterized protein
VLSVYIDKASAFAQEIGINPTELIEARLAPDMLTFGAQIQRACDKARSGVMRLTSIYAPAIDSPNKTFGDLQSRISRTATFLRSIGPAAFEGSETRQFELGIKPLPGLYRGDRYLLRLLLPDFYFHITAVHCILRNKSIQIGKMDYFGPHPGA